jgi:hypothetical protein
MNKKKIFIVVILVLFILGLAFFVGILKLDRTRNIDNTISFRGVSFCKPVWINENQKNERPNILCSDFIK